MPASVEIKFDDYTFGSSKNLIAWDEESNTRIESSVVPRRSGIKITTPATLDARRIRVEGKLSASSIDNLQISYRALVKAANSGIKKLKFFDNWYVNAHKQDWRFDRVKGNPKALRYSISFITEDPYVYNEALTQDDQTISGDTLNFVHANNSDTEVYPKWYFLPTDTITNGFKLKNTTTGFFIVVNIDLINGDVFYLDAETLHIYLNDLIVDKYMSDASTLNLFLNSGNNTIDLSDMGAPAAGTFRIEYNDRYY